MSLRFVYGRAGTGKTTICLNEIKKRIEEKAENPLVMLVPEQFSFQAEKNLVKVLHNGGILKTEVLSFQRMAFRVFNEAGGITYPHIHPAGKSMLIYRILDKMRDKLTVFSKSSDREGFVGTVSSLITEFKRYNVTPKHLDAVSQELNVDNPLKNKLQELNLLYSEFEAILEQRYRDSDDDLTVASEKLSKTPLYDGAEIWIDGFSTFTPQEYKMIRELLKKARRVTVSLCTDSAKDESGQADAEIFSAIRHSLKKLTRIADELHIPIENPLVLDVHPPYRLSGSLEIAHLEKNLYAYPFRSYKEATQDISLFSAMSMFSEIEAAARGVLKLCRDRNCRFRDIAVVTRNLSGYEKHIEVIFREFGIPFFIDSKVEISDHPVVRLISSMMDIFNENWSYESVFRYLKTGLTGIQPNDIYLLENYVLACGIRGSRWTSDEEWTMIPELLPDERMLKDQSEAIKEINRIRGLVSAPLNDFRKTAKGRRSARDFCSSLYDFMCAIGVPQTTERIIEDFKQKGELALAHEYSQVWNILMEVFDQIVEVTGDETLSLESFGKLLKLGLGEYKIGLIPASLDQVLVGSVERTKNHQVKALFILGANDGVFPAAGVKEGILSDQDRSVLNHMGLELASDTRSQAFDEQYLVYRALSTAEKFLRISWPISDNEGKAMRPSIIISRLRKLFPGIDEKSDILPSRTCDEEMELISGAGATYKKLVSSLRQKADGKAIQPLWQDVWRWYFRDNGWKERCRKTRSAFEYRNLAQQVNESKMRDLFGDPIISSVSRLEKYTACPFSFYVQYGLGAKERKIYRLTPPDIGTFMHAVIERFSRLVTKGEVTWRSFDREWCNEKVSGIVDEMLKKMQGSGISASKRYTALAARLKRVIARAVWLIAEHIRRSGFEPMDYEVGFGDNEKYPPISLELDSGTKINLTGRIDRIDALKTEDGTYLRIIDYKSGAKDFRLSDVYYGLQIQLITYLDAIWEHSGKASEGQVLPGGMLYFKIDDPIIKGGNGLTEEEIESAIMRQLKMKGLLLADVKLIKEMDRQIEGSSMIIPATVNKGDVLGKNTSGATLEQFKVLRSYVRKLLLGLGNEIMKGNVNIKPYKKKGATSCQYCSFLSVCQFDTGMKDNTYKLLYDKENEEVWELMNQPE